MGGILNAGGSYENQGSTFEVQRSAIKAWKIRPVEKVSESWSRSRIFGRR